MSGVDQGASANAETGSRPTGQAPSGLDASRFDPARITDAVQAVEANVLQPIIKRAADEFYEAVLNTAEDYLRENLDWNLSSHLSMLERENQRVQTELWEIDRAIGSVPMGHSKRLQTICENGRAASRYMELLWAVSQKHEGEDRHATALRYIRERDSDGSGEAGETAKTGSTEGDSAGRRHRP